MTMSDAIVVKTTLDLNHNEAWPKLPHVPQIGSRIVSNTRLELEVVAVRYYQGVVEVEVHLPKSRWGSIQEFQDWYSWRKI